jgi:hypothetical protein
LISEAWGNRVRLSGFAALLPFAVAAAPVHAADVATLPCIEQALGPDTAEGFGAAHVADMMASAGQAQEESKLNAFVAIFVAKVPLCVTAHKWTDAEAESAIGYTIAKLSLPPMETLAGQKGIDPSRVRSAYDRLPAALRAEFYKADDPPLPAVTALLESVTNERMDSVSQEEGLYIGMLAALFSTLEAERNAFLGK